MSSTCEIELGGSYKQPTKEILHPYVQVPEHQTLTPRRNLARIGTLQEFIPKGYYREAELERMRSGEYLGDDFPFNFLKNSRTWRTRRYNTIVNPVPVTISRSNRVLFYKRLQVWSAHWREKGIHRIRWFRCGFGFQRAKIAAERFIDSLAQSGRIDGIKTEAQARLDVEKLRLERLIKGKRFEFLVKRKL
ncbi:AP2-ERF domain [Babesia duncani]|uniref:AP2-ERF domain n=1 Tax=Babesia duncani TaxID=323732 RepID=A0AAD9PK33_9APIC|nr:AP2-ERF domain [Babesia duncani]